MLIDNVPKKHLQVWLEKALKLQRPGKAARKELNQQLLSSDPLEVDVAHQYIEAAFPGQLQLLAGLWPFKNQRALHMWTLNYLKDCSVDEALRLHKRLRLVDGQWDSVRFSKKETASVRRVLRRDSDLEAVVYLTKLVRFEHEDEARQEEKTERVSVRVNFDGGRIPIVEVYASQQDARNALFALVDWMRGVETPRTKSVEQARTLSAVTFTEAQVVSMASRLEWKNPTRVVGLDAKERFGEISFSGKLEHDRVAPLDTDEEDAEVQLNSDNSVRRYRLKFEHDDTFVEEPELSFHFKRQHLQFHNKTSRPAMDAVLTELRAELKI